MNITNEVAPTKTKKTKTLGSSCDITDKGNETTEIVKRGNLRSIDHSKVNIERDNQKNRMRTGKPAKNATSDFNR